MSAVKYELKEPSASLTRLAVWPRGNARAEHQVAERVGFRTWRLLSEIRGSTHTGFTVTSDATDVLAFKLSSVHHTGTGRWAGARTLPVRITGAKSGCRVRRSGAVACRSVPVRATRR